MRRLIKKFGKLILPNAFIAKVNRRHSVEYKIIKHPDEFFERLCLVKKESWDRAYYPPLYAHTKEKYMEILTPTQYAIRISDATINAESDIVLTKHGAYWNKYNDEEFMTFAHPFDANLVWYTNDALGVRLCKTKMYIKGTTLSLVGVWAFHWCHFFLQFINKLYYAAENGLLDNEITVLIHADADNNIVQIVNDFVKNYPAVSVKKAQKGVDYVCENLICMPSAFPNFGVGKFALSYPYIMPSDVISKIFKYSINPYTEKIKDTPVKYEKIFLTRKASSNSQRNLTNYEEIHDYFKSQGFVDIEGAGLNLEEKADIFYHAKEIVAPHGAALMNLMFCNGAKCLVFTNYRFVDDTCGYTIFRDRLKSWIYVSGQDLNSEYHSGYTIPLEKVKKAYVEYVQS